jgi:hypothetical protein
MEKEKRKMKNETFWVPGERYFIRTVTMYYVGKLVSIDDLEIVLENVSWVADTGQFSEALKTGKMQSVEPFPKGLVCVGRRALIDASPWKHKTL